MIFEQTWRGNRCDYNYLKLLLDNRVFVQYTIKHHGHSNGANLLSNVTLKNYLIHKAKILGLTTKNKNSISNNCDDRSDFCNDRSVLLGQNYPEKKIFKKNDRSVLSSLFWCQKCPFPNFVQCFSLKFRNLRQDTQF